MSAYALLLATTNPGKVAELRGLLKAVPEFNGLTLFAPSELAVALPDVEETGATFAENARLKATALAGASGLAALADDSGLCVDALGGEPGIRSARWAGPTDADRNVALLARLRGVPPAGRGARFVCAVCAATPDGRLLEAEGACAGVIAAAPVGTGGFGYDPVFFLPAFGRTLAELTPAGKGRVSHRALALATLRPGLPLLLGTSRQKNP